MKFLIINGPNLNLLGIREPDIYGRRSYDDLCAVIHAACAEAGVDGEIIQSNHEGVLIDAIQSALGTADGLIINAAGYTHTSVAIGDALAAVALPCVEVHISRVSAREAFRQVSFVAPHAWLRIEGRGFEGYRDAILWLADRLRASGPEKERTGGRTEKGAVSRT